MGAKKEDRKPIYKVTLTHPFCLGKFEVTERQWRQVVMSEPVDAPRQEEDGLPVAVSWNEAELFIQALNRRAGKALYRLPWEAEWEYAARAGSTTRYSFGNDVSQLKRYGNCLDHSGSEDGFASRAQVGSFLPNTWGLSDMHGNVWEWVGDWYAPYPEGPAVDPSGPAEGTERVRRGGGFEAKASNCESSARRHSRPDFNRDGYTGFRLLRIPDNTSASNDQ